MKILVYGAGVIGCVLAHKLFRTGNDVTLLARGNWKDTIDEKGLTIDHYGYFYKTTDKIRTVDKLEDSDRYDLIFVVMQYNNILNILKTLGENISPYIILVGNNMNPEYCEKEIFKISHSKKEIGFGFQGSGGYRKDKKVVGMHSLRIGMTVGGLRCKLSYEFEKIIKEVFLKSSYKLEFQENMEGWLLSHAAQILPGCYLCYALNCNLKRAKKKDAAMAIKATSEAYNMLKSLGYPICPEGEEKQYRDEFEKKVNRLYFIYKTCIGKFVISNHCSHAVEEMSTLDKSFNELKNKSNIIMPVWDKLREKACGVLKG
ncbi:ketopantoate reductase family protein [Clostridium butyricum]|uniref:ketopantoate reductase family protein n=1 Tax=Clostridium butyricum TaxID=1492 RepID=UPI000406A994|nr:2-dehydropantoate 2-reductase N-terminal domain-containing protein [Clostridium butyricum]